MLIIDKIFNGMKIVHEKIQNVRSISLAICIKAGSVNESLDNIGVSHFLEHMFFKGTKKRTSLEISNSIDRIGGEISAFTGKETTVLYLTVMDKDIEIALDILCDVFLNSEFSEEEIEKEKKVILEEINIYKDNNESLIHEENINHFYRGTSLANKIIGDESSLKKITRDTIIKYYNENYTIDNTFISIAGNIEYLKIKNLLEKYLSDFKRKNDNLFRINDNLQKPENYIINKNIQQAYLCINTRAVSYSSEDLIKFSIISNVLGGGMSSRLFRKIREENNLAYSIYSYISAYSSSGLFTTCLVTNNENYIKSINLVYEEYEKLFNEGITLEELTKSKNQIMSALYFELESSKSIMFKNMNLYFFNNKIIKFEDTLKSLRKISLIDIKELSEKHFKKDLYSYSVLSHIA